MSDGRMTSARAIARLLLAAGHLTGAVVAGCRGRPVEGCRRDRISSGPTVGENGRPTLSMAESVGSRWKNWEDEADAPAAPQGESSSDIATGSCLESTSPLEAGRGPP